MSISDSVLNPGRPLFRWAGSKRRLIPILLKLVPEIRGHYIEPFAGSACLYFALRPSKAIISDINKELITTYIQVKENVEAVIRSLRSFTWSEKEYYRVRALDPEKLANPRRAARFIYLNRLCFNGLYRTNGTGQFNVPYGGYKSGTLPDAKSLRLFSQELRAATLHHSSFDTVLQHVRSEDFLYLDPPYSISSRRVFNEYSNSSFGETQLKLLRAELERIDALGVPFLVSYGLSNEAQLLAKGFRARQVIVQRQIAGFVGNRKKSRELIITNY